MGYRWLAVCGLLLFAAASGCDSGSRVYQVTGRVTWNGADLPEGDILFVPEDKAIGGEAGKLKDGHYTLKARAGKKRVEIRAVRTVPGKFGPMGEPLIEDYIPAEYNTKSHLEADVGDGRTTFDFDLKGK